MSDDSQAPLDIKFNDSGSNAWISFHGSWNSPNPVGYHVGYVDFANGQPVASRNSNTSLNVILSNADNSRCPNKCFRPAGLKFDSKGRLLMTSDASGEIYVIERNVATTTSSTSIGGATSTSTSSGTSASTSSSIAASWVLDINVVSLGLFGLLAVVFGML